MAYEFKVSDELYEKIKVRYEKLSNKSVSFTPDELRTNLIMVLAEVLTKILEASFHPKLASAHFAEMFPKAITGRNPFLNEKLIRKAGVKVEYFEALLDEIKKTNGVEEIHYPTEAEDYSWQ